MATASPPTATASSPPPPLLMRACTWVTGACCWLYSAALALLSALRDCYRRSTVSVATAVSVVYIAAMSATAAYIAIVAKLGRGTHDVPSLGSVADVGAALATSMYTLVHCWFAGPDAQFDVTVCPPADRVRMHNAASMCIVCLCALGVGGLLRVLHVHDASTVALRGIGVLIRNALPLAGCVLAVATASCMWAGYSPTAPVTFVINVVIAATGHLSTWYAQLTTGVETAATAGAAAGTTEGYLSWFWTASWTSIGATAISVFASVGTFRSLAAMAATALAQRFIKKDPPGPAAANNVPPPTFTANDVPLPDTSAAHPLGEASLRMATSALQMLFDHSMAASADSSPHAPPPARTASSTTTRGLRADTAATRPPAHARADVFNTVVDAIYATSRPPPVDTLPPSASPPPPAPHAASARRPIVSSAATPTTASTVSDAAQPDAATTTSTTSAPAAPPADCVAATASSPRTATAKRARPHGLATDAARCQLAAAQAVSPDEAASAALNVVASTRQLADVTAGWWAAKHNIQKVVHTTDSIPHHLRRAFADAFTTVNAGGPLLASHALGCAMQPLTKSTEALASVCAGKAASVLGVIPPRRQGGSDDDERNARALRLIADGHCGDALDELHRPPARTITAAELTPIIAQLFPAGPPGDVRSVAATELRDGTGGISTVRMLSGQSTPAAWRTHVANAVKACNAAAAPGVSGFRVRWLADALRTDSDGKVLSVLADFVDGLLGGGARCVMTTVRLVLIPKPDGKWRPLGVGEAIATIAKRIALAVLRDHIGTYVHDAAQYTDESDGVAAVARTVATLSATGWNVCTLDVRNAFNSVLRSRVVATVRAHAPAMEPFVAMCLAPTTLVTGVGAVATVTRGVVQGDPLSSLLFNAALASVMRAWQATCADDHRVSVLLLAPGTDAAAAADFDVAAVCYADDITVVWRDGARYRVALDALSDALTAAGLELRHDKTQCAPGLGVPIADVQAVLDATAPPPPAAAAAAAADDNGSDDRDDRDDGDGDDRAAAPPTPTATPAVMVLGVPVGDTDAARALMHDIIRDRAARLRALDTLGRPQATLAALRTCGLHTAIEGKLKALAPHVADASTLALVAAEEDALLRLVLGDDAYAAASPDHRAITALPMRVGGWGLTRLAARGALVDGVWTGHSAADADKLTAAALAGLMARLAAAAAVPDVKLRASPTKAQKAAAAAAARTKASARDLQRRIKAWGTVDDAGHPANGAPAKRNAAAAKRAAAAAASAADAPAAAATPRTEYKSVAVLGCAHAIRAPMSRLADHIMIGHLLGIDCLPADVAAEPCPAGHGLNLGQQLPADGGTSTRRKAPVMLRDDNGVSHLEMCAVRVKHQRHNAAQEQMAVEFQHALNVGPPKRYPAFRDASAAIQQLYRQPPPPGSHTARGAGAGGYVLLEGLLTPDGVPTQNADDGAAIGDVVARAWGKPPIYVDLTWCSNFGVTIQRAATDTSAAQRATDEKRKWAMANLTTEAAATVNFVPFGIGTDGHVAHDARAALHGVLSDAAITRVVAAGLIAQANSAVALIAAARRARDKRVADRKANTAKRIRRAAAAAASPFGAAAAADPSAASDASATSDDDDGTSGSSADTESGSTTTTDDDNGSDAPAADAADPSAGAVPDAAPPPDAGDAARTGRRRITSAPPGGAGARGRSGRSGR